ncbi:MAG: DNA-processing protein DprA [Actinomycetes bacterium]|jgi:DNA processing protein|nr:DNA-processing protein DprA [Actinomycetes bacterium]
MGDLSDERAARMRLSQLAEPGDERLGRALEASSASSILARIEGGDRTLPGVEHYRSRLGVSPVALFDAWAERGGRYLIPGDGEWPTQLAALGPSAPWGLFVVGAELRVAAVRSVAVVGARAATQYGLHVASDLATDLAGRGWAVVSGGAYGIDAAAHRGALAAEGTTIAALAFGVDVAYPRGHASLFERIREEGGVLLSEFPPGATPTKPRFLTRNRIIAALTRGTVVVEAAYRSGALNTAAVARRLGRPVLVVPGPVTSALSVGCHRLARGDDPARIVTDASEVIEEVGLIGELAPTQEPLLRVRDALDPTSLRVLEAMPSESAIAVGDLSVAAGIDAGATGGALLRMVATGLVREATDGFVRVPGAADTVVRRSP